MKLFRKDENEKFKLYGGVKEIEWCSSVENIKKNIFTRQLMTQLKDVIPQGFKKCPYVGNFEFRNFSLHSGVNFMSPSGIMRVKLHIYNNDDNMLFYLSLLYQIQN